MENMARLEKLYPLKWKEKPRITSSWYRAWKLRIFNNIWLSLPCMPLPTFHLQCRLLLWLFPMARRNNSPHHLGANCLIRSLCLVANGTFIKQLHWARQLRCVAHRTGSRILESVGWSKQVTSRWSGSWSVYLRRHISHHEFSFLNKDPHYLETLIWLPRLGTGKTLNWLCSLEPSSTMSMNSVLIIRSVHRHESMSIAFLMKLYLNVIMIQMEPNIYAISISHQF